MVSIIDTNKKFRKNVKRFNRLYSMMTNKYGLYVVGNAVFDTCNVHTNKFLGYLNDYRQIIYKLNSAE